MQLGERLDVVMLTIKGDSSKKSCVNLVEEIIVALKMHKVHKPIFYDYPINDKGGVGYTYISPISESFVLIDVWSDFKGAYLILCSCKTICLNRISKKIRSCGYRIKQIYAKELNLGGKHAI